MAELKPCPLCGEEASIDREYIFCDYCHLICRIDDRIYNGEAETYQEARQQAIDCWNTRTPKERGADKPKITCLNCKHLMFSDMYGECNKQLRIVNPSDTCEYAEPKERGGGEMTDNEIIKALHICFHNAGCCSEYCPLLKDNDCQYNLKRQALDLIKRQQAEIERLTAQNGVYETCNARKQEAIEHLETELKAMRGAANSYKLHYGNLRMEIAREVCDRLKTEMQNVARLDDNGTPLFIIGTQFIDNLLKEMEKEDE